MIIFYLLGSSFGEFELNLNLDHSVQHTHVGWSAVGPRYTQSNIHMWVEVQLVLGSFNTIMCMCIGGALALKKRTLPRSTQCYHYKHGPFSCV